MDKNQNDLGLEALAMEDYEKVRGKKVRVNHLLGYANRDLSEELYGDFVVRVDETPRQDVLRWTTDDWLDPVYNVTVLEANGLPLEGTGPLRSCWIDGRSYRRGLGHETQPGSIVAETCEHGPDLATLSLPQDVHPTTSDGRIECIIDVVEVALLQFVDIVESAGGLTRNPRGELVPMSVVDWVNLGEAYLEACKALDRKPKVG